MTVGVANQQSIIPDMRLSLIRSRISDNPNENEKISPIGTNQIAGFVEFRPLTSGEKDESFLLTSK